MRFLRAKSASMPQLNAVVRVSWIYCILVLIAASLSVSAASSGGACTHHFLDLGSNAGVQIRKLYEPHRFMSPPSSHAATAFRNRKGGGSSSIRTDAGAANEQKSVKQQGYRSQLMHAFDTHFGPAEEDRNRLVCAYAFEPNPIHAPRLREMAAVYSSIGWRMKYLPYAVGSSNGTLPLLRENSKFDQAAVLVKNASLFKHAVIGDHNTVQVEVIDLMEFIETQIRTRTSDSTIGSSSRGSSTNKVGGNTGRVVIKMDIEGEEYKLLPNLIASGVLCRYVDALYVEYHVRHSRKFLEEKMPHLTRESVLAFMSSMDLLLSLARPEHCRTQLFRLDDESYFDDTFDIRPLPVGGGGHADKCQSVASSIGSGSRGGSSIGSSTSNDSSGVALERAVNASKYGFPHLGVYVAHDASMKRSEHDSNSMQYMLCPLLTNTPTTSSISTSTPEKGTHNSGLSSDDTMAHNNQLLVSVVHGRITHRKWAQSMQSYHK